MDLRFWRRRPCQPGGQPEAEEQPQDIHLLAEDGLVREPPVRLEALDALTEPLFSGGKIERSTRRADLALAGSALAQLGLWWPELVKSAGAGEQLYRVIMAPELAHGIAGGLLRWNGVNTTVHSVATGQFVGQATLGRAGSMAAAGATGIGLPVMVATAVIQLHLMDITRRLRRVEEKVDQILRELDFARKGRLRGCIDCVKSALNAGDQTQCRDELTNVLPDLSAAYHEFACLEEELWTTDLPRLSRKGSSGQRGSVVDRIAIVDPIGRLAKAAWARGRHYYDARVKEPAVMGWCEHYLPIANCRWLAQLTLYATRASLGQTDNADSIWRDLASFANDRSAPILRRMAVALGLTDPPRVLTHEWLESSLEQLASHERLRELFLEVWRWAYGMQTAQAKLRQPEVEYTVRVVNGGNA